jgi:HEAT repeats
MTASSISHPPGAVALRLCLAGWLIAAVPAWASDAGVEWQRGRLTVQASQQPLSVVLAQIQRRTGIVISSQLPLSEPVTGGFDRLPLAAGLHQMLERYNHMIVEGRGRQPLRVFVLGRREAAPGMAAAAALPTSWAAADPAQRVEAAERLADIGDASSLAALRQALTDPSEAVRAVAQQALAAHSGARPSSSNK